MSSTKSNSDMLKAIRGYNKEAREKKAKREGFTSAAQMIAHLEGQIKLGKGSLPYSPIASTPVDKTKTTSSSKSSSPKNTANSWPTIHVVDVVDKSGSMSGSKDSASVKGVNSGVDSLVNDTADVHYTYTLCDFADDIIFRNVLAPLNEVKPLKAGTRGSTALFDAIGKSIEHVKPSVKTGDKVLVNIYTDGQENASRSYNAGAINTLIKTLSEVGWTFTFIGTDADVRYVQQNLSVHESNTLVHDNTAESMSKAFTANSAARSSYSAKVSAGEDVSVGFYKDIN